MTITLALAGDTMLGRGVAEELAAAPVPGTLFSEEVREILAGSDLFVLNLECCVSDRGARWPDPGKPFFFRAPPIAATVLAELGVDCVTLANNHALDFGADALADTLANLEAAGVRAVGAGADLYAAREFAVVGADGLRLAVVGVTDHPEDFAAGPGRPGVALADLDRGVPGWLTDLVDRAAASSDAVLVTPHWGPNMTSRPPSHVLRAAPELLEAGATLVAGHSSHVFHGVAHRIAYDMGDFVDDYAVHPRLRNDLGLLFLVTLDGPGRPGPDNTGPDGPGPGGPGRAEGPGSWVPVRLEAVPLFLDYCRTAVARGGEWEWIRDRFTRACAAFGTEVAVEGHRLVVDWT
ncbi:CapA family protein [Streptomyces sp. NPDC059637]|uniref:CapA family protein n=1 Tax=Streptomyces sp. NPDC059637 TaxID=3347752 RepID=UPI00367370C3